MPFTIDNYLDAARARHSIASDRELGRRLGLSKGAVNHYRMGHSYPDDGTMLELARLALVDPSQALIDLNIWRCKSDGARALYSQIAKEHAARRSA